MRYTTITIVIAVLLAATAARAADQINAGKVQAEVSPTGLFGKVTLADRVVVDESAREGFQTVLLSRFVPSGQDSDTLAPALGKTVPAELSVAQTSSDRSRLTRRVLAKAGTVSGEVAISVRPADRADALDISCEVTLQGGGMVSAVGLALPIVVGGDEYWRKTTVGGGNPQRPTESWRLNRNRPRPGTGRRGRRRGGWPQWRLGGLLVSGPGHYLTWKASDRDTSWLPMDRGTDCPGWLDYSEREWGLTVLWKDIDKSAPAGIWMEGDTGVLTIYLHPPSSLPLRVAGKRQLSAKFELAWHEGPHPVTFKPELTRTSYLKLLEVMDEGGGRTFLRSAASTYRCRDAEELIDSGVQPSMVLAVPGKADWRMKKLCKDLRMPFNDAKAKAQPRKYAQELIHAIIRKFGGKTSFRF